MVVTAYPITTNHDALAIADSITQISRQNHNITFGKGKGGTNVG